MKIFIICIFSFVWITLALFSAGIEEKQIDIYYSSSLNGNLDGCECRGNPRSGLVKRAVFLRTIDRDKSLLLETGDIFDVYPDELLSDYILESYLELGYDAIAVGDQEFSNGAGYLLDRITRYPLLGSNLGIKTEDEQFIAVSETTLIVSREGLDIAVFSIIDPEVFRFYPEDITESIEVEDPEALIPVLLEQPGARKADLRVLLFHGPLKNARQLAEENPSMNVIIAGHEQQIADGEMIGNTILVSPGAEGNMLGHLQISANSKKLLYENRLIPFDYLTDPDDGVIRSRIDEYNRVMIEKLKK